MTAQNKKITKTTLFYIALILIAIIWIIPIYTLLATAVKSKQDFFSGLGLFSLPRKFAWVNFANAFTKGNLGRYMVNGLIICVLKVPLGIFVEALAAFAMTRLNVKHKTRPTPAPKPPHRPAGHVPRWAAGGYPSSTAWCPRSWSSPPSTGALARSAPPPSPACWSTLRLPCYCCASQPATASMNPSGSSCCSSSLRPPSCCLAGGWRSGWGCEARPSEELNTQVSCTDG